MALKINAGKYPRIPAQYSDELFNVISWMLQHDRRKRPRTDDLIRTASPKFLAALTKVERQVLQYDRMVFEHRLQVRQNEMATKEAELSAREADLQSRAAAMQTNESAQSHKAEQLEKRKQWLDEREAAVLRRERAVKRKNGSVEDDNKENPGAACSSKAAAMAFGSGKRAKTHQQHPPLPVHHRPPTAAPYAAWAAR